MKKHSLRLFFHIHFVIEQVGEDKRKDDRYRHDGDRVYQCIRNAPFEPLVGGQSDEIFQTNKFYMIPAGEKIPLGE